MGIEEFGQILESGFAQGEKLGAFQSLKAARYGSRALTSCGLIIGQRVKFAKARKARTGIFALVQKQKEQVLKWLCSSLPLVLSKIILEFGGESIEISCIRSPQVNEWGQEHASWAIARIRSAFQVWDETEQLERVLASPGIGPWTRKAFGLLCLDENHMLHEDAWISKRWQELVTKLPILPNLSLKHLEENKLPITFRQLSFLLWRITSTGIRQLAARQPLTHAAFIQNS
jgi:3-methyladenine DNA glycosylase/8-oxoguanine DNA glycosylase